MKFKHLEEVTAVPIFSPCGSFRYQLCLTNTSIEGSKTACVIMQNPSVANAEYADKSVQFLEKLIFQKDYKEFENINKIIIVNQFAYVQTNNFTGEEHHVGAENDTHIKKAIENADIVIVAWGKDNPYQSRKSTINAILSEFPNKPVMQTKKHPSRGTYTNFIESYNN